MLMARLAVGAATTVTVAVPVVALAALATVAAFVTVRV